MNSTEFKNAILVGIPHELPQKRELDKTVSHAPKRRKGEKEKRRR
jgi:hypothetical protein